MTRNLLIAALLLTSSVEALAETVDVKYRGPVTLDTFECSDVTDSSFVQRVCYDAAQSYMLIQLKATYYHYCEIGPDVVQGLLYSPSKGKYFNAKINGSGSDGPYDCRTHRVPAY